MSLTVLQTGTISTSMLVWEIVTQRVHVGTWDILGPESRYMGTPLGPKYIPYTYMDPLGKFQVHVVD